MHPFQFRLETLLKFRHMQEEQAQLRLGEATARLVAEQESLATLKSSFDGHLADFRNKLSGLVTIETLKILRDYADKLKEDVSAQAIRVEAAAHSRRECIAVLEEAAKARKLVEKLREKKLAQYQAEALAEEQKLLDELGLQAYSRGG